MAEETATSAAPAAPEADRRGRPKTRVGVVTSNRMSKTVVVTVRRRASHAKYGKIMTRKVKYMAHAEDHDPKKPTVMVGDTVLIAETRPLSKDKRWRVVKVIERATAA